VNKHYNKTIFQGEKNSNKKRYFEGWYYKQVNRSSNYTVSFIPGVSYNSVDPHCFIQCIICNEKNQLSSHYFKYDISEFTYNHYPFLVQIEKSKFYQDSLDVELENSKIKISGKLSFINQEPLHMSPLCPNIMGIFSYIPRMECNHHIISMNHKINGTLLINDKKIDLNEGFGYMEKDWGESFPSEYIWLQCNHFENRKVKIALSAANIPFLGFSFRGFFCSLFVDSKEYRFATYNRSKLKVNSAKDGKVSITLIKGKLELNISGEVDEVQSLASPKNGIMNDSIKEGLAGKISISLKDKSNGYELSTIGSNAGIEIMMTV
jgi:hypothetical protein